MNYLEQYVFHLIFRHMRLIDLIYFARTSKKFYTYVEDYLKIYGRRFKNMIEIPNEVPEKYNSLIHYVNEEFVCLRCYRCGNTNNFYYKYNWNLRICGKCFKPYMRPMYRYSNRKDLIDERKIKGFTTNEVKKLLIFTYDNALHIHRHRRLYYKDDVRIITKNRYGFNTYENYLDFINRRKMMINHNIICKLTNIKHELVFFYPYRKSNSGYILPIENKEEYEEEVKKAITRYKNCIENLAYAKDIYDTIMKSVTNEQFPHVLTKLRLKYNFICLFDLEVRLFNEDIDKKIFYSDKCFIYFKNMINIL
jgi:hypothetical protein